MPHLLRTVAILVALLAGLIVPALADKRVALVVGNADYRNVPRLLNPRNDAEDMAETLRSLGFEVVARTNADRRQFTQALVEFSRVIPGADVALVYYAGHGLQYQGRNYLMPTDAELKDEISLRYELVSLEEIQEVLDRSGGTRVMILDACRNNPLATQFARNTLSATRAATMVRGLARIEQARSTVVAYSTQANEVAEDGTSRNSPFTSALLTSLREPGLEIGAMFRDVAVRVYESTKGKQIPELSISLLSDVYLNRNESAAQAWDRVRAGNDRAAVRDFLTRFPNSFYAADARARLDMLDTAAREQELRERLNKLEVERKAAEAELARQRLAAAEAERLRAVAAQAAEKEKELAAAEEARRVAEQQLADMQKQAQTLSQQAKEAAAAEVAARQRSEAEASDRIRLSAAEVAEKDRQIAAIEADRRKAEARLAEVQTQMQALAAQASAAATTKETQARAVASLDAAPLPKVDERTLVTSIQEELRRLGCYPASIDSNWQNPAVRKAIVEFANQTHLAKIPEQPTTEFLDDLKARRGPLCAPSCGPRERLSNGRCIAKTCGADEILTQKGECVARPKSKPARTVTAKPASPRAAPARPGRAGCFSFNGRQFCE